MTLYRLYVENGCRAGFWVQHRDWNNICAQVRTVAGLSTGKLPGSPPTHDNAEVLVQVFDVRSGREMTAASAVETPADRHFTRIAEPHWSRPPADRHVLVRQGRSADDDAAAFH